MRRFLCGFAAVLVCGFLAGCRTTERGGGPDVSIANIFPQPPAKEFPLADPQYAVYDLSKLRVGMSMAQVGALFGKPTAVKNTPSAEYWEYDWFELYFREGLLANWFDLPAARQKFTPSSRSSRAGRRGASGRR